LGVGWYLFSPLLIDSKVNEVLAQVEGDQVLNMGQFEGVDRLHQGSGTASLVRLDTGALELRFEDFSVTNGPALKVWLSEHEYPRTNADATSVGWISLGDLKGNVGNQAYEIPADLDLSIYKSVAIWCQPFGVLFASAPLGDIEG